jgi:hypothetical protein
VTKDEFDEVGWEENNVSVWWRDRAEIGQVRKEVQR